MCIEEYLEGRGVITSDLKSNNLLHILELFLTVFGVMPLHVLTWLEKDNVGFPGATTISRYSQEGTLHSITHWGNYYEVSGFAP